MTEQNTTKEFRLAYSRLHSNKVVITSDNPEIVEAVKASTHIGGQYLRFTENSVSMGSIAAKKVADDLVSQGWTETYKPKG